MIVETVTTTINPDGTVNCAAMGVEWGDEEIVIKPFRATRTLRNLQARGAAVVNLTDDILLFTQAALEDPHPPTRPADAVDGAVLADACSWREVTVEAIDATGPRARVTTRVVGRGSGREFIGFNRASHAVLEASILASRAACCRRRRSGWSWSAWASSSTRRPAPRAGRDGPRPRAGARRDRRRMTTVRVEASARLHMGMLDASGDGPRRFGGFGVAVNRPAVVRRGERERRAPRRRAGRRARPAVALRCRGALPDRGACARARGHSAARRSRLRDEAGAGRDGGAGRAGGAVAGSRGDGAHGRARRALGGGPVDLRPRRLRRRGRPAPRVGEPAPLLTRHAMPDEWRCVLVIPAAEPGLSGSPEEAAFTELRPDPARSAEIAQLVLTALLPALVERDLAEFGSALSRVQRLVGDSFAPVQGGTFHPQAAPARRRAAAAGGGRRRPELVGPGRLRDRRQRGAGARGRARARAQLGAGGRAEVVRFDNHGARVEVL